MSLNKQRASNLQRLRTTKSPLSNTDRDLLYVDTKQGNFSGNFRFAIEISTLKLDMNFFWAEGLRNINFGCGPLPACGDCQLLLGGGHTKQIPLLTKVTHLLLGRCLHLFTILFLRKPHFYVFGGSQFCQLWTWHVFFLLDLKPRTRSGYVCLKRNDFPQRRARKGEHFRARRN